MNKKEIKSLDYDQIIQVFMDLGEKTFRAKQVYEWLHVKLVNEFHEMTNLSKDLRQTLETHFELSKIAMVEQRVSKNDETTKFLFALHDDCVIESVLMKYKHGNSVCISSQVGCRMGCHFCASTLGGLERNLTAAEMLDQIYQISRITGERVSHVVVMGTGEPFDNYDNLLKFIQILTDEHGLNISQRNITVSTCGIVEKIRALAEEKLQITLAISLHAPNDSIRKELMPVANRYSIDQVIEACKYYFLKTSRRITFEYSLVKGVNDSEQNALELVSLIRGMNCHVNLIPVNAIKECNFKHSEVTFIQKFKNILEKNKINVTIRREMGRDIEAACGQLRKSYIDHQASEAVEGRRL